MMDLKDLLKSFRDKQKLTQQELANKSGLSRNSISNYERGDRIPKVDDLKKIADALDIDFNNLLGINVQDKKIKIKTLEDYTTEELLKELLRREKTNE